MKSTFERFIVLLIRFFDAMGRVYFALIIGFADLLRCACDQGSGNFKRRFETVLRLIVCVVVLSVLFIG
jgi:hypothetical protein